MEETHEVQEYSREEGGERIDGHVGECVHDGHGFLLEDSME